MKKILFLLFLIIFGVLPSTYAAVDSIYDYIKKIDENYVVAVGLKGAAGESFAAADIVIGLKQELYVDIEPTIETLISPKINKILVGHPCGNSLIKLSCEKWPYEIGQAIIKIIGNDLIIAGTTVDDTRRAAKVIAHFKDYPLLKQSKFILVKGETLEIQDIEIEKAKTEREFVCGDNVCEPGEKFFCFSDCELKNCFIVCPEKGFDLSFCRDPPTNTNLPFCKEGEKNQGYGYCATGKVCCCGNEETLEEQENVTNEQGENLKQKKKGFFARIWKWLKEFVSIVF